ncbi:hypothetical protein BS47DRAFT_1040862 [Hydnum rufescens UP504]|uniref:Uncharacterized protein n=1 Tax=Hydnum rufescens UP504 TaxID=1448309 RepID=A0A9P6DVG9_9AGAM|nr:hypothetical protein BS47DRAFT_1040862 [Hydnum rufescens UP504]
MDVEHAYAANAAPHYPQEHQHHWQQHGTHIPYPASPSHPTFPPFYPRPPDHFSQPQASTRPSTANLSLNLSSLSVEPSAPSPHVASNPNGPLTSMPVSPDGVQPVHGQQQQQQSQQQQHVFAPQIPTSPFTYSTHEWHSQMPISRSNSSSDMRSDTPMSNPTRNGTIRPRSIEEDGAYDSLQSSAPPHHVQQHCPPPNGHDLQHHHSFSSSAHDDQEAASSFADSHAESPTSANSDPPDELRSADPDMPPSFGFAKFDNVTGRPGTASRPPASNNFVAKLYQSVPPIVCFCRD